MSPALSTRLIAEFIGRFAAGIFSDLWLYIVGPVVGGVRAGLLYNARFKGSEGRAQP